MIAVSECGRFARAALSSGPGEVRAVFRRSVYLGFPGGRYACLGDASIGRGPLNARVADRRSLARLELGDKLRVVVARARIWRPGPSRGRANRAALAGNLASLVRAARSRPVLAGLGGTLVGARSPLIDHARPALEAIDEWLMHPGRAVPPRARALIGLGPGLTPSGDDFLGGLMIGLRAAGERRAAAALWRWLEPRTVRRTSAISRAHLAAAAQGEANEALHACIDALFGPAAGAWRGKLTRLDAVGHSSGRDGLAGVVAVARGRLR